MKKFIPLALLTLFTAFFTHFTVAQTRANTMTFTLGAAFESFSSKRDINNRGYPIAALGYNFTPNWGIEAMLGVFHTRFFDSAAYDNRQVSGTLFMFDGIYHIPSQTSVEPFLIAGLGVTGLAPNRFDAKNEANFNFGLGALVFADPVVAFRLEARDIYTFIGGKNDVFFAAGVTFLLDLC